MEKAKTKRREVLTRILNTITEVSATTISLVQTATRNLF